MRETYEWLATGSVLEEGEVRATDPRHALEKVCHVLAARDRHNVRVRVLDDCGEVLADGFVS